MTSVLEQAKQLFDKELDDAAEQILERWQKHVQDKSMKRQRKQVAPQTQQILRVDNDGVADWVIKQLTIDDQSRNNLLHIRLGVYNDTIDTLSQQVYTGEISIGQWQEAMKTEIRMLHNSSAAIGKGGWTNMTSRDWGRLGPRIKEQYRYLQGFAEHIDAKRDTISLRQIVARAKLYGEAAVGTTIAIQAGFWFSDHLPWMPRDGSTNCLVRCHCSWALQVTKTTKSYQTVKASWRLGVAEHCDTCVGRAGHVEVLQVPIDVDVPQSIGGFS